MTCVGTPAYIAPEVVMNQEKQMPYTFSADVFSCGLVFLDLLSQRSMCEWMDLNKFPGEVREKLRKKWPKGAKPPKKSQGLDRLEQKMLAQAPGDRITFFQFSNEIVKLNSDSPMPHEMWKIQTKKPQGPPPQTKMHPAHAANLAGSMGFAVGSRVLFNSGGSWKKGVVEHISTTSCPGAAQVQLNDGNGVLVCPWQFRDMLRPDAQAAPSAQAPVYNPAATIGDASVPVARINSKAAAGYGQNGQGRRREVPEAKGKCATAFGGFTGGIMKALRGRRGEE